MNLTVESILQQWDEMINSNQDDTSWIDGNKTYEYFTSIKNHKIYKRKGNSKDSNGNTLLYFHYTALASTLSYAKKIASQIGAKYVADTKNNAGVFRIQKTNLIDGHVGTDSFKE